MSNFDHFVTQWMSRSRVTDGSACSSSRSRRERPIDQAVDPQVPLARLVRRDVADVQHREAVGEVLAGRQAGGVVPSLDELGPVALEEAHGSSVPRHAHRYARRATGAASTDPIDPTGPTDSETTDPARPRQSDRPRAKGPHEQLAISVPRAVPRPHADGPLVPRPRPGEGARASCSSSCAVALGLLILALLRVRPGRPTSYDDGRGDLDAWTRWPTASSASPASLVGGLTIAVFVLTIVWQWRLAKNHELLGRPGTTFGPGWAIGAWFIPIANLVLPFLQFRDLWKGSDAGLPRGSPDWKRQSTGALLWVWWGLFVASVVIDWISSISVDEETTRSPTVTVSSTG